MKKPKFDKYLLKKDDFVNEMANTRVAMNLSQAELSKLCGLSQSTISRIENGDLDPRLSTAFKYLYSLKKTIGIVDY